MKKVSLLCLLLIAQSACASDLMIQKNEHGYKFYNDKMDITVPVYMASKSLKDLGAQKAQEALKNGSHYLTLTECSDGSYAADLKARIKGGGPITAAALYWITKSTIYGAATVATGAAVATTGGMALGIGGTAGIAVGAAGGAAVLAGAAVGAAEVAGVTAVVLEGAALGTAGVVSSAGGIAGAVACVEAASMGAFTFGMWLPLP